MENNLLPAEKQRVSEARKVTWIGFFVNLVLSVGKILAGFWGRSSAMIADGVHSLSDFVTDLIVIIFIGISSKGKDENHQYGHGKFETFATMIISFALFIVAFGILWNGCVTVYESFHGKAIGRPSAIALWAALISIVVKEGLYWYTVIVGRRIDSPAVIANGWHHRSDALSSIGTLIGISVAMFLGDKLHILDPLASIVVSVFIFGVAYKLALPSIQELLEESLPAEVEKRIGELVMNVPGVKAFHHLRTRKNGHVFIIDIHIKVDKNISIVEAHDIATQVEQTMRRTFGDQTQTNVHVEPYYPKDGF